jgi:hypothetical protein
MDRKTLAGIGAAGTLIFGGIDATVLDEKPLQRLDYIANEVVEVKQTENVVETSFSWKDQPGLKVSVDLGEPTLSERFNDKRTKELITERVDFGDGGFKVDILLNEKPDTNVFCYQIEGAEHYDFFYQPPLTQEEIAAGAERPPEIEGSYALYHKSLANHQLGRENYATGKVMHIPRPQVWELNNPTSTTEWADLSYTEEEGLCVEVSPKFLDSANYPVRVDPTFGYTNQGGTFAADASDSSFSVKATAPVDGIITKYTIYGKDRFWSAALYQRTNATSGVLISDANVYTSVSATAGWFDLLFNTTIGRPAVTSSTVYWLTAGIDTGAGSPGIYYDAGSTGDGLLNSDCGAGVSFCEDPIIGTSEARLYSIYATYCDPSLEVCVETFSVAGSYEWTPFIGVDEAIVACWGGGGGGGDGSNTGGGGGGGGAFASSTITVVPGDSYTVTVGGGGSKPAVAAAGGGAGGDSSFWTNKVIADGGNGGAGGTGAPTGGSGGSTANSSGTVEYAGGSGGAANNTSDGGGGGGGAGGPHGAGGAGGAASATIGGAGGAGDNGSGGAAGTADSNGSVDPIGGTGGNSALGGGGGGGGDDGDPGGNGGSPGGGAGGGEINSTAGTWGAGASGQCTITYTIPDPGGGGGGATSTPQSEMWF